MKNFLASAALLAAAIAATPATAAIVDSSFETQGAASIPTNGFCYFNSCAAGAWSSTNNGAGLIGVNNGDWPGVPADGQYFGFIQGGGDLFQTFTADRTGRYQFNWQDAGRSRGGFNGAHDYTVTLDGQEIGFGRTDGTTAAGQAFSTRGSGSFLLTAGQSYTLSFNGVFSGADATSFIDRVGIAAVPEPATWAMMIGGFGLVGGSLRRRKARGVVAFA